MNSVFDPDPDVLSGGNVAYFAEYAGLYQKYRVTRFSYDVYVSNQGAEGTLVASVAPTKDDLGNNYANSIEFGELAFGKSFPLLPRYGQGRFKGSIDLAKFSGYKGYLTDDITSSLVDSNPLHMYYFNIGVNTSLVQSSNSFAVRTILKYHVTFYERSTVALTRAVQNRSIPEQSPYENEERLKSCQVEGSFPKAPFVAPVVNNNRLEVPRRRI